MINGFCMAACWCGSRGGMCVDEVANMEFDPLVDFRVYLIYM